MLLESEESEEEEADWMPPGKRKNKTKFIKVADGPKKKKAKKASEILEEDYDEEEDEDYEYEGSDEDDESDMDFILHEAEEASEDEELEEMEEEEEKVEIKKTKQKKKGKNKKKESVKTETLEAKETPKETGSEIKHKKKNKATVGDNKENIEREALAENNKMTPKQKTKQSPKSEKKTPKNQPKTEESSPEKKSTKKQKSTPKKIKGGTTILDMKEGDGPVAKQGKRVTVFYRGVIDATQKQFDSCIGGNGFVFRLGKGEVISGWDAGVEGMKVGGKRRITIPPHQGYGRKRVGPIPPNSTLIFDVELKSIK